MVWLGAILIVIPNILKARIVVDPKAKDHPPFEVME